MEIHTRIPGNWMYEGLVSKNADLNSQEIQVGESAAVYTLASLKKNQEIVKLRYNISETFNGTVSLGNGSDPAAYISNADFPKSGADVLLLNKILTADADIKLTVAGCTTGEGFFKLIWEV